MPLDQRVAATLEEYADLTANPEKLKGLLAPLARHSGKNFSKVLYTVALCLRSPLCESPLCVWFFIVDTVWR
jgi:hypothetical protein